MFDEVLIESAGNDRRRGVWVVAILSGAVHALLILALVWRYVDDNPKVLEKPMHAFSVAAAPPPPPPPPPPSDGASRSRAQVQAAREPRETPREVPVVEETARENEAPSPEGAPGGVRGGQAGGILGDTVGGELGGRVGGQLGGQLGGQFGGQSGGTADRPLHVGGNVKAPIAVKRVDPVYTEIARRARIEGIVIIEAVIDREGNVTEARVLKPLPMGLDVAALAAVRQWRFRPGTLDGQPVPVYYNLTVNFRIE